MNLTIEPQESFILARIEDARFDALSAPDFKARMAGALTGAAPKVVLDLSPVTFIDSAGLASILSLVKGLPEGGELRIAGARDAGEGRLPAHPARQGPPAPRHARGRGGGRGAEVSTVATADPPHDGGGDEGRPPMARRALARQGVGGRARAATSSTRSASS